MLTVSRRGLFAIGGTGAAVVLTGCGSAVSERDDADDAELLDGALEAEAALGATYDGLSGPEVSSGPGAQVLKRCQADSKKRQAELASLGASQPTGGDTAGAAGSGLEPAVSSANAAIAAYRQGARLLGETEQRATCTSYLAQVAAELASIRGLFGEDQAPVRVRHRRDPEAVRGRRDDDHEHHLDPDDLDHLHQHRLAVSEDASSRRDALRRGARSRPAPSPPPAPCVLRWRSPNPRPTTTCATFSQQAIGLEQITALAYSTAADAADAKLKGTLETFRDQEQAHASALRSALDELGFDPPDAPDSPSDTTVFDEVDGLDDTSSPYTTQDLKDLLSGLDGLKGTKQYLDYLVKLEEAQIGYYVGQAPGLDSVDLSTTGAEIAGCQAEHLIVVREQQGDDPAAALGAAIAAIEGAGSDSSTSTSGSK